MSKKIIEYETIEITNGFMSLPILYCPECQEKLYISRFNDNVCSCGNCHTVYNSRVLMYGESKVICEECNFTEYNCMCHLIF
jgi:hypothetical protein